MDAITFTDPVQRTPSKPSMDGDDDNSFAGQLVRDGINGVNETAVGSASTTLAAQDILGETLAVTTAAVRPQWVRSVVSMRQLLAVQTHFCLGGLR